jgi:dienelactone hydrolase
VNSLPAEIQPDRHYLFYLHGQIVEDQGVRPVHPEFGVYEYEAILASLAEEGFLVVSEARGPGTDGESYARKVVKQVETLLAAGVEPERISVVGFSKGGGIAVRVSSLLGNEKLSFVFMATCVTWIENWPELDLRGRVLSIYEVSDPIAGSCKEAFSRSVVRPEFKELRLEVGGGHGAFYRSMPEWLDPVVQWVTGSGKPAGP